VIYGALTNPAPGSDIVISLTLPFLISIEIDAGLYAPVLIKRNSASVSIIKSYDPDILEGIFSFSNNGERSDESEINIDFKS
jgi:hypothetical protein